MMYNFTENQLLLPIISTLLFMSVFIIASIHGFLVKKDDAERWAGLALDSDVNTPLSGDRHG